MADTPLTKDRERVAERLLGGSVKRSYDPYVDIDWDAPLDPDKFFLPPKLLSLYGTPIWEGLSHAQRVELSKQEMAGVMSTGIWFENILNQALLRMIFHRDPSSKHVQYALTEMGDECRHMLMFGRLIEKVEARPFRQNIVRHHLANALPFAFRGTMLWVAALVGEEIFDSWQRQMMNDPQLQPIVHQVMRIHVAEEARHIRWARESVARRMKRTSRWEKEIVSHLVGFGGPLLADLLTNPAAYARAGLDPHEARRQAMANPHFRKSKQAGFDRLRVFLEEQDLLSGSARRMWRRAGFVA